MEKTAKPSFKLTRRRGCAHGLCALVLLAVAVHVFLDCRPSTVLAAQIPLPAPSAFVVYRPDGRMLITESHDEAQHSYAVDFWDTRSGQAQGQIRHEAKINDAAFSLDGRFLVTGSDISADVWNLETQKRVFQLQASTGEKVNRVAFSPNGQWIATQGGTAITLWDAQTGLRVEQMNDGDTIAPDFAVSPDSHTIAYLENETGSAEQLCVWHVQQNDDERCFDTAIAQPGRLRWSPNGQQLALGDANGLWLWKLPDGTGQKVTYRDENTVTAVDDLAYGPVGPIVALSDGALPVLIRNSEIGTTIATLDACRPGVHCHCRDLTFAPNGQALALQSIDEDGGSADIQIWEPSAGHW